MVRGAVLDYNGIYVDDAVGRRSVTEVVISAAIVPSTAAADRGERAAEATGEVVVAGDTDGDAHTVAWSVLASLRTYRNGAV